ncbi:MAG: efflux RND transporter periplasmic adaptor subunit [Leptospiraceae bacterium]|nr:efflux RND transporter periplasmic adaptor subunit [Leptospiraceae bacterium]MCP5513340.1 efflux RND transporter periplasmic adaptor subunit [Leptospiraceae bacterium]
MSDMKTRFVDLVKKMNIYWIIAVIAIIAGAYFVYGKITKNKANGKSDPGEQQESVNRISIPPDVLKNHPLTYTKIRERGFYEEIVLPGKVSFDLERMANVGSRVPARIKQVYVKEGDMINTGAPLAVLTSIEVGNAQSNFLKSKARLESLKSQLERATELFEKKIISAKEFEMTNVEYRTIKTEMETSFNTLIVYGLTKAEIQKLETGELESSQLILRSPIAGTVTERRAVNGQAVVTEDNLFIVANLTRLWILLDVYEKDLYSVKLNAEAVIFTLGDKPETVKARVAHVGEVIDPVKHTAEIRLEVDNHDFKLKPGQTVSAKVQGLISESKSKRIMVVPSEAVHKIEGNSFVFIAHSDGSFEPKSVEIGETIDDDIEIKTPISVDDNIVSQGSFLIKSEYLK